MASRAIKPSGYKGDGDSVSVSRQEHEAVLERIRKLEEIVAEQNENLERVAQEEAIHKDFLRNNFVKFMRRRGRGVVRIHAGTRGLFIPFPSEEDNLDNHGQNESGGSSVVNGDRMRNKSDSTTPKLKPKK